MNSRDLATKLDAIYAARGGIPTLSDIVTGVLAEVRGNMGTKEKPGKFDCFTKAEPDEPMFVLLARDPLMPALVEEWALRRQQLQKPNDDEKIREARMCAEAARVWRENRAPRHDWQRAFKNVDERRQQYADLIGRPGVNVNFVLSMVIDPLLKRFHAGERTVELHDAMMAVE